MIENRPRLNDPLWNRIIEYQVDDPHAMFPFSKKLAKAQNWDEPFTRRAIDEYKKFIYLCCISPHGASPSPIVDEVWHLHLTYTTDYWQRFCRDVLQQEIHHQPSRGGPDEKHKHEDWYDDTLKFYSSTFGTDPPPDIWPKGKKTLNPQKLPTIDFDSFFELGNKKRFLLLLLPLLFILILYGRLFPFSLPGPQFLVFYFLLSVTALTILYVSVQVKAEKLRSILPQMLDDPEGYELSYLAGGQQRLVLHFIANLIEKRVLINKGTDNYEVDRQALLWSTNPISNSLTVLNVNSITVGELIRLGREQAEPYEVKYQWLQQRFDDAINNILLPLGVIFIGFLRVMQGMAHQRPIGYLIVSIVMFLVATVGMFKLNNFNKTCRSIFWNNPHYSQYLQGEMDTMMVFTGFAAIASIPDFEQLDKYFGSSSGGDSSGGGCGSSCGGGGCGGGCGGCGG